MDYTPNPAWVDKILKKHWAALERLVGREAMPIMTGRHAEELGCGHYGCALKTHIPGVVLKVSSDPSEAAFVGAALSLPEREWPDGMIKYVGVLELPETYRKRPTFVLWRQEATEVGISSRITGYYDMRTRTFPESEYGLGEFMGGNQAIKQVAGVVREKLLHSSDPMGWKKFEQQAQGLSREVPWEGLGVVRAAARVTRLMYSYKGLLGAAIGIAWISDVVEVMENEPFAHLIAQALGYYLDKGILLADVHLNNIGLVKLEGYSKPEWVITDPGHMVPLLPKWQHISVPQL